jgi:hypothetical protein
MSNHPGFLYFAFVFFVIAAVFNYGAPANTPWHGRLYFHFGWAGLACWVATLIRF